MLPGDELLLLDGQGLEYLARIDSFAKGEVTAKIVSRAASQAEPSHSVTLYLSLLNKPDKYEWALQKCTELGVACFIPLRTERSLPAPPEKGRRERWERIIREAAEQSGRAILPSLGATMDLTEAVEYEARKAQESGNHTAIMPVLGTSAALADVLARRSDAVSVSIFIGPEGGFTAEEARLAAEAGLRLITLGPRTLRAETAAVTTLSVVMHELGELGGRQRGGEQGERAHTRRS
jgi:16S rRNA (uracil1498-N3)-methyltransferase